MATDEVSGQRGRHWLAGGIGALLAIYFAIAAHWTSKDLVWSFWFTTLCSGIFLTAVPLIIFGIAAAFHPDTEDKVD